MIQKSKQFHRSWDKYQADCDCDAAPYYHFLAGFACGWTARRRTLAKKEILHMTIHKVMKSGSSDCLCGVRLPQNTTIDDGLVSCQKCKKRLKGKKSGNKGEGC